ncbi:CE1759 family FMN reductase [Jonesiaceae bacterium BS-20]|uniref:CE1759 family FMN reductase n=1 Tax=Jonesiaceae bacterium BS-20 TaxID=3120821 RepID=A0AAU7DZS3_9MICO
MSNKQIVVISAGLSQPSSTRLLADRMSTATQDALLDRGDSATIKTVEIREYARDIMDNMLTGFASSRLEELKQELVAAHAVIAVSPIFSQSLSGLFKSFLDVLDTKSLVNKPVFLGATAGTKRHSLALEYAIRPVFSYLRANVAPTLVFAASDDWGEGENGQDLNGRIAAGAKEFAAMLAGGGLEDKSHQDGLETEDFANLLRAGGIEF